MIARDHRYIGSRHYLFGLALAAHGRDGGRRRADEANALADTFLSESCVFAEEAESGVESLALALQSDLEDFVPVEVALGCDSGCWYWRG